MHDKLIQFITLWFETRDYIYELNDIEDLALALEKNFEIKEKDEETINEIGHEAQAHGQNDKETKEK